MSRYPKSTGFPKFEAAQKQCSGSGSTGSKCFGSPGSGFTSQMYGSGSGSFYHQAKIVRKTWFLLFCNFFWTFYLWKWRKCRVPSKSNRQKNCIKNLFFVGLLKVNDETRGSGSTSGFGSICQRHVSPDPDPHQNVMDPEHCSGVMYSTFNDSAALKTYTK